MDLKLDKTELEALVDLLAMSEWVLFSNDESEEDDPRKDKHLKLLNKLYKYAYKNGLEEQIECVEDSDSYYPSDRWEDSSETQNFIEEYDEVNFWDSLVERLTFRDMDKEIEGKDDKEVDFEKLMESYSKYATPYYEEFDENGVENLVVNFKK